MRKTYRVNFIDHNGHINQKLLEADSLCAVYDYMFRLGYIGIHVQEVK